MHIVQLYSVYSTVLLGRKPTSDVAAVQQRLEVADLLQKSRLGEQEVLLYTRAHTHTHSSVFPQFLKQWWGFAVTHLPPPLNGT